MKKINFLRVPLVPPGWGHGRPWGGTLSRFLTFFPEHPYSSIYHKFKRTSYLRGKIEYNIKFWEKYLNHQAEILRQKPKIGLKENIIFIGVPMDIGVGYRHGTRFGPLAIRQSSAQFGSGVEPGFDLSELETQIIDIGDIEIHSYILDSDMFKKETIRAVRQSYIDINEVPPAWIGNLQRIEYTLKWMMGKFRTLDKKNLEIDLKENKSSELILIPQLSEKKRIPHGNIFPVVLGGDHSITISCVKAIYDTFSINKKDFGVIYFDAHPDYLHTRNGLQRTHASQAKRVGEIIKNPEHIVQIGLRYIEKEELAGIRAEGLKTFNMIDIGERLPKDIAQEVFYYFQNKGVRNIYLSIDIDVLDAGIVPGTGSPEPGGMQTRFLIDTIRELGYMIKDDNEMNILAMDIVEVAPDWDIGNVTALAAVKIILEAIGSLYISKQKRQK